MNGRLEIVWKTAPTIGEVEASTNPRLSVNEDPSDAPPNAGAEEAAAATGNEPAPSSVPALARPASGGMLSWLVPMLPNIATIAFCI
jgi:hypothetical protein